MLIFAFMKIGFFESTNFLLFYVFILNENLLRTYSATYKDPVFLDLFQAACLPKSRCWKKYIKIK